MSAREALATSTSRNSAQVAMTKHGQGCIGPDSDAGVAAASTSVPMALATAKSGNGLDRDGGPSPRLQARLTSADTIRSSSTSHDLYVSMWWRFAAEKYAAADRNPARSKAPITVFTE